MISKIKTTHGASNVYGCMLANLQSMPVLIFGRSGEVVEAFIKGIVVVVVLFIIIDEVVLAESVTSTIAVAWGGMEFVVRDVFGNTVVVLIIAAVDVGFLVVIVLVCAAVVIACVDVKVLVVFVFDGDAILCVVVVDTNVLDAVLVLVLSAG